MQQQQERAEATPWEMGWMMEKTEMFDARIRAMKDQHEVFFVLDLDGNVLFDNGGMPLQQGDLVGRNISELDAAHAEQWRDHIAAVIESGEAMMFKEQNEVEGKEREILTPRFPV